MMNVIKNNGSVASFDASKIHECLRMATDGILGVDDKDIFAGLSSTLVNGMKTSDIQDEVIFSATQLINERFPNYTYVAARLLMQKMFKEVNRDTLEYPHLREYFDKALEHGQISDKIYHAFDLDRLDAEILPENDDLFKFLGLKTLYDRYLIRESVGISRVPKVIELPQHLFMRVAMGLYFMEPDVEQRHELCIGLYRVFSFHEFLNSTPTLFNSGRIRNQLSSCYLSEVPDDLLKMYEFFSDSAQESKWAGGCGSSWSRVRCEGSPIIGTNGTSKGIVPFLKIYNHTATAVNQCFTGDTEIVHESGPTEISQINVGDTVLTSDGSYQKVRRVMKYDYDGPMIEITTAEGTTHVTPEHPVLVIIDGIRYGSHDKVRELLKSKQIHWNWVEAKNVTQSDLIIKY